MTKSIYPAILRAAIIAGGLLAAVYISLGLLGVKITANGTFENGTAISSSASTLLFGKAGTHSSVQFSLLPVLRL